MSLLIIAARENWFRAPPGESVMEAGPWLEPGSLRHPGAADRVVGVAVADAAASILPPSPLPVRNSELPPERLDRTPPSSARCRSTIHWTIQPLA